MSLISYRGTNEQAHGQRSFQSDLQVVSRCMHEQLRSRREERISHLQQSVNEQIAQLQAQIKQKRIWRTNMATTATLFAFTMLCIFRLCIND